jgi:hypothetical protein
MTAALGSISSTEGKSKHELTTFGGDIKIYIKPLLYLIFFFFETRSS